MRLRSVFIPISLAAAVCVGDAAGQVEDISASATVTTSPSLDARVVQKLIDGNERSGIAFPVGSKGEGAVTFRFPRPRVATGLRFLQTSDIYFTTRFAVRGDKDGDGEFELTLCQADAAKPREWTSARWEAVEVRGLRLESVAGVSKGRRAHPCLGEVQVFGIVLPTDAADARAAGNPVRGISGVRPIDRWIDLSGQTRPVAVVHPEGDAYCRAAVRLAELITSRGGKPVNVVAGGRDALPDRHNVVALGNVNNNGLVARLYWNHYAHEDALLPGPAGWTLRTVYDPYPWHGKGDVVVVGVSDEAGLAGATRAFAAALAKGRTRVGMDYHLSVSSVAPLPKAVAAKLTANRVPSFRVYLDSARLYLRTGHDAYARHAIATLDRIAKLYERKPDHDCDWPEETRSDAILGTWDAFEECPLITAEQHRRFTLAFLRFMRAVRQHVSGYSQLGRGDLVTWNHTTFPLMGLYFGSRYFWDYYGLTEAKEHLTRARSCLMAQAKSPKPQEDADGYLALTMRHAIDYCLAEWELDPLKAGTLARHADYVIGMCDNMGWPSGFGDSGIGVRPSQIQAVLPRAFWFTKDPRYLWVLRHTLGDAWPNPFHPGVTPSEAADHIGVRVFPLDPQLYEHTRTRSFYNEPKCPPNVPLAAAFDKITFREHWGKKGQYLILDGFSRGKHLHYDANAALELVDHGQRWLLDHDYLTRNTTEHNMLSVLRDGRAERLVPSCAGLRCAADPGGKVGLVSTEVREYMGVDWTRDVFWLKGEFFLFMDSVVAREAAHYDLDLVWKVEDRGEEQIAAVNGSPAFVVERRGAFGTTRRAAVVRDADASGGKAVAFDSAASVLSMVVELPAGAYALKVRAYGIDGSSDSLYASFGANERVGCHVPQLRYGPANTKFDQSGSTPRVVLGKAGRHVVSLSLRERPPVRVDCVTFASADGKTVLRVEAEDADPPRASDLAGMAADRCFIKWADPVEVRRAASTPKGIVVPVCKLFQRTSADLREGGKAELANLIYVDNTTAAADLRIRRVGEGVVAVEGKERVLLAREGAHVPGLQTDAMMLYLSPSRVAWAKGSYLSIAGHEVRAAGRCDLEVDLLAGKPVGGARLSSLGLGAAQAAAWLQGLSFADQAKAAARPEAAQPRQALWEQRAAELCPVRRLRLADLDGDGRDEIVVAGGRSVAALGRDGKLLWRYGANGPCYDAAVGELDPRPGKEVVVACGDTHAYLLSAKGEAISQCQMRGPAWNQSFGDRPWKCLSAWVADLEGDGKNEIMLGTESYELRIYDGPWKLRALARKSVYHGSRDLSTIDADRDGKLEILATNRYGGVGLWDAQAARRAYFYTSIGDVEAIAKDIDRDGNVEVVCGSSTGDMVCRRLPREGSWAGRGSPMLWRFDNFGYGVNRLAAADLDGDGRDEVLVASQTGYLYALTAGGKVLWHTRVGADIVEVIALKDARCAVVCFDRYGDVAFVHRDGTVGSKAKLPFRPSRAVQLGADAVVVGGQGGVVCLPVAPAGR